MLESGVCESELPQVREGTETVMKTTWLFNRLNVLLSLSRDLVKLKILVVVLIVIILYLLYDETVNLLVDYWTCFLWTL